MTKRGRIQRLTGAALKRATLEECKRRINEACGRDWWGDSESERLQMSLLRQSPSEEFRRRAMHCYQNLRNALLHAQALASEFDLGMQAGTLRPDGCAAFLSCFTDDVIEASLKRLEFNDGHARVWAPIEQPELRSRAALVVDYDEPDSMWWKRGKPSRPSRTELAVLSILAGHWPTTGTANTPAEVIEAEAKNIDYARTTMGLQKRR